MKKSIFLVIFTSLLVSKSSNAFNLDTLFAYTRPVETDSFEVYLVIKGYFGAVCNWDCSQIDILPDTVDVKMGYYVGNATVTCSRNDTLFVGKFYPQLLNLKITIGEGVRVNCDSFYRKKRYTLSLSLQNTSVLESEREQLFLFPNPTKERLKVRLPDFLHEARIEILSATGVKLITPMYNNEPNFEIDVSPLPAGIYFLQLSDEKQRVVRRFVKE